MGIEAIPTIQRRPREAEKLSCLEPVTVLAQRHMYGPGIGQKHFASQ